MVLRKRLADPSPLTYHSGDHVGIMAENRTQLVNAILDRCVNKPLSYDEPVQLQLLQEKYTPMGNKLRWDMYVWIGEPKSCSHFITNGAKLRLSYKYIHIPSLIMILEIKK